MTKTQGERELFGLVQQLRDRGLPIKVVTVDYDPSPCEMAGSPGVGRVGPEAEVDEGEMQASDSGPFDDVPAMIQTPGQLIDLADLANALQPGRRITIGIEAIAYDQEAVE